MTVPSGAPLFAAGTIVTNTTFTPDAREFANRTHSMLRFRDLSDLTRWIADNVVDDAERGNKVTIPSDSFFLTSVIRIEASVSIREKYLLAMVASLCDMVRHIWNLDSSGLGILDFQCPTTAYSPENGSHSELARKCPR